MAIVVTKSEQRPKPVTMLKNARAWFITLADRAANWTPWVEKQDTGADKMAGEVIQSIIGPIDGNLDKLREILGEELFAKFNAEKSEEFDGCVKYVQADEEKFEMLDGSVLGDSGFKAVFGRLQNTEKADEDALIPFDSKWNMPAMPVAPGYAPFHQAVEETLHKLKGQICALVSLDRPVSETRQLIEEQVTSFQDWLTTALDSLEQATKADKTIPKPKITDRLKSLLWGQSATQKGEDTMTPEEIKAIVSEAVGEAAKEAAAETVNLMVEKAEKEEAAKAESDAQKAADAKLAERDAKLDEALAWIAAQKAEKEAAEKGDKGEDPQLVAMRAELEKAQSTVKSITEKMDALQRTPGGRTSPDDGKPEPKMAKKYDSENPYAAFNDQDMFGRKPANA